MAKYSRNKPNATDRAVTRAMSKKDPTLAPKQEEESQKPKPPNRRVYTTPWCNIVMREVMAKFPTITRKAAQRKVRRIIREATESEKRRWRRLAVLPPKKTRSESSETEEEEEEVDEETQHKSETSSINDERNGYSFDYVVLSRSSESVVQTVSEETESSCDALSIQSDFTEKSSSGTSNDESIDISTFDTSETVDVVTAAVSRPAAPYSKTIDDLLEQAETIRNAFEHLDKIYYDVNFSLVDKKQSVDCVKVTAVSPTRNDLEVEKKLSVDCVKVTAVSPKKFL